jgi:hypothetical protein
MIVGKTLHFAVHSNRTLTASFVYPDRRRIRRWFQSGSNTQIVVPIQVQLFFTIRERFVIMEPYPFPNPAFRLSTTLSILSPNCYIHTRFPALDCPFPSGIPLGVSGASGLGILHQAPPQTLWMTGIFADTSGKHYGNVYANTLLSASKTNR